MGGGFALMVAVRGEYDAASVNYGGLTDDVRAGLPKACPIVASYGGRDPTLRGAAAELASRLRDADVPHDVKEYPSAGHGFMNDHSRDPMPWLFVLMGKLSRTRFDAAATADARRRILAFFAAHLGDLDDPAVAPGAQV
jgi:carboxymethylenebutenolidase